MINRLSNIMCWLVLVTAFVATGCEQGYKPGVDVLAYEPDVETIVVANDYVPRTIGATGGYQAWIKTKELEFDCVVTFYRPDDSFYLTEHRYEIYPWSNSIRISGVEPQGEFFWQFSESRFNILEGFGKVDTLPINISGRDFSEAVLGITTAPVRLLESKVASGEEPKPVKIKGIWYYPIERAYPIEQAVPVGDKQVVVESVEPYWSKVVFYQNRDNSLVDMIWFAGGPEADKSLTVRGYDYHEVEKKAVLAPSRIEIFKADAQGVLRQRLVKIDFK